MPEATHPYLTKPHLVLITGNMASGKSTVAQALAECIDRCVHLRGDIFRRMIITGQAEMTLDLSAEARAQLQLRYDLSALTAKHYYEAGFSVIYQDVLIGPALGAAVAALYPHAVSVVVLCPSADTIAARERARSKRGYPDRASIDAFDRVLHRQTPKIGYWLDTSHLTVEETVACILGYLKQSEVV